MAFENVAELPLVKTYERAVRVLMGLPLRLVRPDLPPNPESMEPELSPFCRGLAGRCWKRTHCWRGQQERARRLAGQRWAPQVITCFAGLRVLAVPVIVDQRHVATWLGGQALSRQPGRREVADVARKLNQWGVRLGLREVENRLLRCPVIRPDRLRGIGRLLALSALHIEETLREPANRIWLQYKRGEPAWVRRAKVFTQAHLGERLTARRVASVVHVEPRAFLRVFREATGTPFRDYLLQLRVRRAKALLAGGRATCSRIASSLGFSSVLEFTRVFQQFASQTAEAYRARYSAGN